MKPISARTVDEYFAALPAPARTELRKLRTLIRSVVPADATETISYGMPAFRYKGPLVCYAAFTGHCSLFPMGSALIKEFKKDLKDYATSKGTIRFPLGQPLPAALIKKLVKVRVAQNEAKPRR